MKTAQWFRGQNSRVLLQHKYTNNFPCTTRHTTKPVELAFYSFIVSARFCDTDYNYKVIEAVER